MNYSFTLLDPFMAIGDALEIMNTNSLVLDEWVSSIELSATNFWGPVVEFYNNSYVEFNSNIDFANSNLENWKSCSSLIEVNSSKWIEPIVLFYPYVTYTPDILNNVSIWVNKNYNILNVNNGSVFYVENQTIKVFCLLKQKIIRANETRFGNLGNSLYDSTSCQTADSVACSNCSISFSGHVDCDNGDFDCGGSTSCKVCQPYPCNFTDPLTNQTVKRYSPYIKANLAYNFVDEYESNLISFSFIVKNCKWENTNII